MNDNFLYNISKYSVKVNTPVKELIKNTTIFISEKELYVIFIDNDKLSYKTYQLQELTNSNIENLIIENKVRNYIIDNDKYNIFEIIMGKYKDSQGKLYIHGQNF